MNHVLFLRYAQTSIVCNPWCSEFTTLVIVLCSQCNASFKLSTSIQFFCLFYIERQLVNLSIAIFVLLPLLMLPLSLWTRVILLLYIAYMYAVKLSLCSYFWYNYISFMWNSDSQAEAEWILLINAFILPSQGTKSYICLQWHKEATVTNKHPKVVLHVLQNSG